MKLLLLVVLVVEEVVWIHLYNLFEKKEGKCTDLKFFQVRILKLDLERVDIMPLFALFVWHKLDKWFWNKFTISLLASKKPQLSVLLPRIHGYIQHLLFFIFSVLLEKWKWKYIKQA